MKKLTAALAAAVALLAPSVSFAAPTFRILDAVEVVPVEIRSLEVAEDSSGVSWETNGASRLEFSVRCKGGSRVSVSHEDGTVSYVRCDGKTHPAYVAEADEGQTADVALEITGDRAAKVFTMLKVYQDKNGKKGKLMDKAKVNLTIAPEEEEE